MRQVKFRRFLDEDNALRARFELERGRVLNFLIQLAHLSQEVCPMAQANVTTPADIVERNLRLTEKIMRYLLNNPQLFNSLPDNFELVVLPDDDPEIRLYNLDLLDRYGSEGQPVVFARIQSKSRDVPVPGSPRLFVPVPLMERVGMAGT